MLKTSMHTMCTGRRKLTLRDDLLNWSGKEDLLIANPPGLASLPRHGTTPDVIFYRRITAASVELIEDGVEHRSDYLPLFDTFDTFSPLESSNNHASRKSVWDFNTGDWYSFRQYLDFRICKASSSGDVGIRARTFNCIVLLC